jgi:D-glycero-alpha-D-manno-heptose-7-phosphate kinase
MSGGYCGIQDQAAAVYGGVNLWKWTYGKGRGLFKREPLLDAKGRKEISKHILVAYSGKNHSSLRINRSWIKGFLSGETRQGWISANKTTHKLAHAIGRKNWKGAAAFMKEEMDLRKKITPHALIPITGKLIRLAEGTGCGARFTGAGAGGSVWALGGTKNIRDLKVLWQGVLNPIRKAGVLECSVDSSGVK